MNSIRRRDWQQLTWLFLGAALIRILLGRAVNGPCIFTDEFQYVEMARSIPRWQGLYWDTAPVYFPCWLYPILIAAPLKLLSWDSAYAAMRVLNAVLMALTIFPAYGLARELAGHRRALAAAALVALLPAAGYSPMIMTESLFFPVVMLALWAIYRAVLTPTPWRRLGAGLVCGLAFHVKPHGMLLPMIAGATVVLFEADRLREAPGGAQGGRLGRFARGVGAHWLTALGWAIAMLPRLLAVKYIERPGAALTLKSILGSYNGIAEGKKDFTTLEMLWSFSRFTLAWAWCTGLIPAWMVARKAIGSLRKREPLTVRLLVILTVAATGAMLYLVARHTLVTNPVWVLHERYFFVMLPLALILFAALAQTDASRLYHRWPWDLAIAAVVFLNIWIAETGPWTLGSGSPTFTGLLFFLKATDVGLTVIVLFLLPIAAALALLLFKPINRVKDQCLIVGLLFLGFNIGWYGFHERYTSKVHKPVLTLARKIDRELVNPEDRLMILDDGLDTGIKWQVGMRNPGVGLSLAGLGKQWWEQELRLGPDGRILPPATRAGSWLLASTTWKVNRAPANAFDECALYKLDRKNPLILDAAQVALARRGAATTDTMSQARAFLNGLKISTVKKKMPADWVAGRVSRIEMQIRNDSAFALPGGAFRMHMGYHWSDPERTKSWTAVIWDDGHQTRLPEWLEPGKTYDLRLGVLAPEKPGDRYMLWVSPLVITMVGKKPLKLWSIERQNGFGDWAKVLPADTKDAKALAATEAVKTKKKGRRAAKK